MGTTNDPSDPRLTHGVDKEPVEQAEVYIVLSEEERRKGFVRPVRAAYKHVGPSGPKYPLRDLSPREQESWGEFYAKYMEFPEGSPEHKEGRRGRLWTQVEIDSVGKGCGSVTTMGYALAETYARDPKFYGSTYCCHCRKHLLVDEFVWDGTDQRVGS